MERKCHHGVIRYNLLIDYQASVSHIHAATAVTDSSRNTYDRTTTQFCITIFNAFVWNVALLMLRSSPGHELDSRPSLTHVQLTHDAMQHAPALQMLECHRPHTYLSQFPPPRQDAGAIKAAMRQFAAEESHGLRATNLTSDYMLHSAKHVPLAYFG